MLRRDEAAAVMLLLRPGIGIEQIRAGETALRQHIEEIPHIARMDADIRRAALAQLAEHHRDAVDVGLAADEAVIREAPGHLDEMLAAAEADLEHHRPAAEERGRIDRGPVRVLVPPHALDPQPWQVLVEVALLRGAQRVALETAVEVAPGGARGMGVACHGPRG